MYSSPPFLFRLAFFFATSFALSTLEELYRLNEAPLEEAISSVVMEIEKNGAVQEIVKDDVSPVDRSKFAEAPQRDLECDLEISGSTIRDDFRIQGVYEHLNGVTFSSRPTYWNSKQQLFLFYLEAYNCWAIGKQAGSEEDLASYASDEAEHPLDISKKWKTALSGEWQDDSKVFIGCNNPSATDESKRFRKEASQDRYWKKWAETEITDVIPTGYEMKQGFLASSNKCDMGHIKVDHHTALANCWNDPKCGGVTYQSKTGIQKKPIQVWLKSCVEFYPSDEWVTFVKKEEGEFEHKQVEVVFQNNFDENIILHLQNHKDGDEEWGMIWAGEPFSTEVDLGSIWYAEYENGTFIHEVMVTGFGGPDGTGIYTFCKELIIDYEAMQFKSQYLEENDREWIQIYPRDPPIHPIWEPVEVGYKRTVSTTHHKWHIGDSEEVSDVKVEGDMSKPPLEFIMETKSTSPKVFVIEDALSVDECNYIMNQTEGQFQRSKILADKTNENYDPNEDMIETISKVRTSTQTWLASDSSGVIKNIFFRIGDLLRLDNEKVANESITESLQVLHYSETQQYKAHHDYMEPSYFPDQRNIQRGYNRFATILFYLHPAEEGGGTGFPLAKEGELNVELPQGSAVLFYNMLEDGNLDHYSRHSGNPVIKGDKYASNLWIWDPIWGGHL